MMPPDVNPVASTYSQVDTAHWYSPLTQRLYYPSRPYAVLMRVFDPRTESYWLVASDAKNSKAKACECAASHCAVPGREAQMVRRRDGRVLAFYLHGRSDASAVKFAKLIYGLESLGCNVQPNRDWQRFVIWANDLRTVRKRFAQVGWWPRFEALTLDLKVQMPGFAWQLELLDGEVPYG